MPPNVSSDGNIFHIRFKNIQYKTIGGDFGHPYSAYDASGIGYFKKLNSLLGLNIWYYFNGELLGDNENSVNLNEFYEISLQVESPKYYYCGVQVELGYLFYIMNNPEFSSMRGLFLKGTINLLSFGLNY